MLIKILVLNCQGIEVIEGISLDTTNLNEVIRLSPTTFSNMPELRLLKINGNRVFLSDGPLLFPDRLSYLSWPAYPLNSLSTNFTAKKLVELDMRGSQLEQLWDGVVVCFILFRFLFFLKGNQFIMC